MCASARSAVEQVGDDLRLAEPEHFLRNLAADRERAVGQRLLGLPRASLNSSCAVRAGQHDERALGAGNLDGRVEHQGQHFLQHAAGPEGAEPSSSTVIWRRSSRAPVRGPAGQAAVVVARQEHAGRRRRPGPAGSGRPGGARTSVAGSPLTKVPYREALSRIRNLPSSRAISACSRETSLPPRRRSFVSRRPIVNGIRSIVTTRSPSTSRTSSRGVGHVRPPVYTNEVRGQPSEVRGTAAGSDRADGHGHEHHHDHQDPYPRRCRARAPALRARRRRSAVGVPQR